MERKVVLKEVINWLLILLFIYAAASKLMNYKLFIYQIDIQPFDDRYTKLIVFGVPAIEFIIAGLLIFNRTNLIGLWMSLILMLIFTGYIILIKLNYYGKIPCSCGGIIEKLNWTQHLLFNIFFVLISILGINLNKSNERYESIIAV